MPSASASHGRSASSASAAPPPSATTYGSVYVIPSVTAPGASANSHATRAAAAGDTSRAVSIVTAVIAASPARFASISAGQQVVAEHRERRGTTGKNPCSVDGSPPG